MGTDPIRDVLADLGCSRTEIDAYLAVLDSGEATMRSVSERADVSQSYVYELATDLAERGLVTVDESATPTAIRARPPAEAVEALSTRLASFERAASERYAATGNEDTGFETLRSPRTVRRRMHRHVERARHSVFAVLPATELGEFRADLEDARDRGVTVYAMVTAPSPAAADLEPVDAWATVVRTWDGTPPLVLLRDARAGVSGTHELLAGRNGTDAHAVAFGQPEVAAAFHGSTLGNVWQMGTERGVAEPPALPATFGEFQSGVTAAALHRRAGTDLVADATLFDTETGAERSVEGAPVTEVHQQLVEPTTAAFPVESALVLETPEGSVSVGGISSGFGPYYEPYAAEGVTLREA